MYALFYAEFLKNAQVCIYSLADLNIYHCVEFTFPEGKFEGEYWKYC